MAQTTVFPLRFGLQVPRGENTQSVEVFSEGGLDLTQSIIENRAGCASVLTNFEPSLRGGYRRINGFIKYVSTVVPGEGPILGVIPYFPSGIIAARKDVGTNTYSFYTGLTWTKISGAITCNWKSGMVLEFDQYNWNGTYKVVITDGVNPAYVWNGSTFTVLNQTGAPTNPKFCKVHKGYLFLAGYSTNSGAISLSSPLVETDWLPVDGAAEIVIGDTISGLNVWQDDFIIFGKKSVTKITGNTTDITATDVFTVKTVTSRIGCIEGRTIKELDGDLLFLATDGIRTISGTYKIGETEIASISRPVQQIVSSINPIVNSCHAVVVNKKTQYRLFYPNSNDTEASSKGVLGSIRRFRDGHEAWEWGELQGFKPSCAASAFLSDGQEYVMHGGYDGYVYQQEIGNSLNGAAINETYTTVPLELGDEGTRKCPHRVTIFFVAEGSSSNVEFQIIYNYNDTNTSQPAPQLITNNPASVVAVTYDTGYQYDTTAKYDVNNTTFSPVLHRQLVQGSGFQIQLSIAENADNPFDAPYVIQGFYIEFFPAGRR